MEKRTAEAEELIGYTFADKELLTTALTHSSYVNEHGGECNERLEFLGDSILNFIAAEHIYKSSPASEGEMSKERAALVSERPLASAVEKLGLLKFLRLGEGAAKETRMSGKFKSNLFEAVVAAIYLDSGDLQKCREFIIPHLDFDGRKRPEFVDYKSRLQEFTQSKHMPLPVYRETEEDGLFVSTVYIEDKPAGEGKAKRKKDAQQSAAKNALEKSRE